MGIISSFVPSPKKSKPKKDRSLFFEWEVPIPREELKKYSISPVFTQNHESFIAYINRKLGTLFIYCCSALQWHYDECFNMKIEIRPESFKCKKKHRIKTVASFTKKCPFVAISMNIKPIYYAINITLPPNYPYSRKDLFLGLKNSGSTCYMSSVLQVLFHIGAFRQLIYSFKDPKEEAPAALQHLFVQLQIASRPLTLDHFITAMGSVSEMSFQQQDAHEFLVALLERLETDLGKPFSESLSQLFEIKMRKVIKQRKMINNAYVKNGKLNVENENENEIVNDGKKIKKINKRTSSISKLTNDAFHTMKNQIKKINLLNNDDNDDQDDINNFEESDDEYEYEYQYEEDPKENNNKNEVNKSNNSTKNNERNEENEVNKSNNSTKNNEKNEENEVNKSNNSTKNNERNEENEVNKNDNSTKNNERNEENKIINDKDKNGNLNTDDENEEEEENRKRIRVRVKVEKKDPNMRIVSKFEETFMFLPITVDGINSLHDSLKKMLEPENLSDYEGGPAIQESKFIRMPPVLILQLCRYKYSKETNSVIELTTPFKCPNSITIGGAHYFLFAIVSHSGSPTFGHYLSFIKIHLGKQWYAFDDAQVSKISKKDVKDSFELKGKSRFKTLTFGCPRAYIVFYCRDDSSNLITATDSIPLYLAPHKTNRFYSHFIFYDQIKGSQVNQQHPPVEWADPTMSIYEILRKIRGENFQPENASIIVSKSNDQKQEKQNNNNENISLKEANKNLDENSNITSSSSTGNTVKDMINKYGSKNFSSDDDDENDDDDDDDDDDYNEDLNSSKTDNKENLEDNKKMKEVIADTYSIDNKTDSNHIPLAFSAWAMLPGQSQFIGPLSLDIPASAFVVQGHPTEFFLLPAELDNGPIFVTSDNPPRIYIDVCLQQNLPQIQGYELLYKLKKVPKELSDGSFVVMKPNSPKTFNISGFKLSFQRKASYSDVQTKLGVLLDQSPEKIILLRKNEPMKPQKYPFVSTFPSNIERLEYQILKGKATACSVSLYTPISFIFISILSKNQHMYYNNNNNKAGLFNRYKNSAVIQTKKPIWFEKNSTCKDIIEFAMKNIIDFQMSKMNKMKVICSKGYQSFIIKPLSDNYIPHKIPIRIDMIRYDLPANKWKLKTTLSNEDPMSIEVRMTKNLNKDEFVGTSRLIPINKDSTVDEVVNNIKKLNNIISEIDYSQIQIILFVIQKISIQQQLNKDDNLYNKLREFLDHFTLPKMRACIAIVIKELPVEIAQDQKNFARSLSGIFS